jgi:hypothetical protein
MMRILATLALATAFAFIAVITITGGGGLAVIGMLLAGGK